MASWPPPSRNGCATGCCTSPPGSPAAPGEPGCGSPPVGPGRPRWSPRSPAWPPYHDRQPDPRPSLPTLDRNRDTTGTGRSDHAAHRSQITTFIKQPVQTPMITALVKDRGLRCPDPWVSRRRQDGVSGEQQGAGAAYLAAPARWGSVEVAVTAWKP